MASKFSNSLKGGRPYRNPPKLKLSLKHDDVYSLEPLRAFHNFEFNAIPFVQRSRTFGVNSRLMYKNIISGRPTDEAIALLAIEPFYFTLFFH